VPPADHIERVDHVAIALPDVAAALPLVRDILGASFIAGGDNPLNGMRIVHFQLRGLKLELLAPLREDSLISPFLGERGPGLHHITFFVDDLRATVAAWEEHGLRAVGTELSSSVWKETFLRPQDAFGTLLQFVETTRDWSTPTRDFALEDVLAGRVQWRDFVPCLTG
jgi:methylmalonyl-CoA epimerase